MVPVVALNGVDPDIWDFGFRVDGLHLQVKALLWYPVVTNGLGKLHSKG